MEDLLLVVVVLAGVLLIALGALFLRGRRPPAPPAPTDEEAVRAAPSAVDTAPPAPAPPPAPVLTPAERFRQRLGRARSGLGASVAAILGRGPSEEAWEELEEALIAADVGVDSAARLVAEVREQVRERGARTPAETLELLKDALRRELAAADRDLARRGDGPTVWLVTGVNGTGKTTSIGKLAARHARDGEQVVLAAADTFRAAAADQLERWADDAGARIVRAGEGADPASVAYDGYASARSSDADLLLVDTAGRLQNKRALMEELRKVKRVLERDAGPCDEVLLVLDATTGQNGLSQARAFMEAVDVSGVVLTKLDGTARGGIVVAIQRELGLPVKLVGLGEGLDDLAPFDPAAFVEALFAEQAQDVTLDTEAGDDGDGHRG